MKHNSNISDEILNAYIDGELSADDSLRVRTAIEQDRALGSKVAEIQAIRKLMKSVYDVAAHTEKPPRCFPWQAYQFELSAIAAVFVVMLTAVVWLGMNAYQDNRLTTTGSDSKIAITQVNVLFHVSRADKVAFRQVLNQVENIMREYQDDADRVNIEIIANGGGLTLFEVGNATFSERVSEIKRKYPNVRFLGCRNTHRRLTRMRGIAPILLEDIDMVDSGIIHVLNRQGQGWSYVQT